MVCPACGSENRESAKFCDECGAQLETLKVEEIPEFSSVSDVVEEAGITESFNSDEVTLADTEAMVDAGFAAAAEGVSDEGFSANTNSVDGFDFSPIEEQEPAQEESVANTQGLDTMADDDTRHLTGQSWGSGSGNTMKMPRVEGKQEEKKKEFRAPDAPEKKKMSKGRKALLSIVIALAVLLGGLGLTLVIDLPNGVNLADAIGIGNLFGGKKVPDVTELDKDEATKLLEDLGFEVRTAQVKSDEDDDIVLLMDPEQGSRVPEGETIVLHVAIARSVPDVVGKSLKEAQKLFEEEGLTNIKITKEKSNKKENTVLSVNPAKGEKLTAATEVEVKVAEPYKVPEVAGMDRSAAVEALKAAGYEVRIVASYSEDVAEGLAVYTDPAPGEKLNKGETVTLGISKSRASELVEAADQFLESAGTITLGDGTTYQVSSVEAVEYVGNDVTVCTIVAAASTVLDGEVVVGSYKTRTVSISWSADNHVVAIA